MTTLKNAMSETAKQMDHGNGCTRLVGLIGWPSEAWPSGMLYNAAFRALELNWRCVPLPVPMGRLRAALLGLRALGFVGAELTESYQNAALDYVEELSPAAESIGAVKFVRVDEHGQLVGDNIQWLGFLAALRALVPSLKGLRPLIIGAGNAARSVVYALVREGLPLTIVDERIEQAIELVHHLRHALDEHSFSVYRWPQDLERLAPHVNLIVNTTRIGTWPDVDCSPWPDDLPFPSDAIVVDLVALPRETRVLRQARASGARTVSGLSVLACEAALTFESWTGCPIPVEVMLRVAHRVLGQHTPGDVAWPGNVGESQSTVSSVQVCQ